MQIVFHHTPESPNVYERTVTFVIGETQHYSQHEPMRTVCMCVRPRVCADPIFIRVHTGRYATFNSDKLVEKLDGCVSVKPAKIRETYTRISNACLSCITLHNCFIYVQLSTDSS